MKDPFEDLRENWTRPPAPEKRPLAARRSRPAPPELEGISVEEIARHCRVDLSTARRWKRGAIAPPETALMVLRIKAHGELDDLGPEWTQWRYKDGTFWSPDKWRIDRNDALSVPLMHGQVAALRAKIAALEQALDDANLGLEEQPLPEEWNVEIAYG